MHWKQCFLMLYEEVDWCLMLCVEIERMELKYEGVRRWEERNNDVEVLRLTVNEWNDEWNDERMVCGSWPCWKWTWWWSALNGREEKWKRNNKIKP